MKTYIVESGSVLPILSTILFLTIFVVVVIFLLTDRRQGHHERMRHLSLDDDRGPDHG